MIEVKIALSGTDRTFSVFTNTDEEARAVCDELMGQQVVLISMDPVTPALEIFQQIRQEDGGKADLIWDAVIDEVNSRNNREQFEAETEGWTREAFEDFYRMLIEEDGE